MSRNSQGTHLNLNGELKMWINVLSKYVSNGFGFEPPTLGLKVKCMDHYTTIPRHLLHFFYQPGQLQQGATFFVGLLSTLHWKFTNPPPSPFTLSLSLTCISPPPSFISLSLSLYYNLIFTIPLFLYATPNLLFV